MQVQNPRFGAKMKFSDFVKNKLIVEMAFKGDVPRGAIKLDSDDIEFLQQFEPQYWIQAIEQRYSDDLYDAIVNRDIGRKKRASRMVGFIKNKLKNGRFKWLDGERMRRLFGKDEIEKIKRHYGREWREKHKDNIELAAKNAAEDIAYYAAEKMYPDVAEPKNDGYKDYKFRDATFSAKPFVNRLVHKIERTKGESHPIKIGLSNDEHPHGKYGFDLSDPHPRSGKVPPSTSGMQLITYEMAKNAIKSLLMHNFHQYYGRMPKPGEIIPLTGEPFGNEDKYKKIEEWKPIKLARVNLIDDTHNKEKKEMVRSHLNLPSDHLEFIDREYDKNINDEVRVYKNKGETKLHAEKKKKSNNGEVKVDTSEHDISTQKKYAGVIKKIIELAVGSLPTDKKGPPIPGKHEDGLPINQRQVVHLPHFKKKIIKNGKEIYVDMPHVLPTQYYTKVGEGQGEHGHRKDIKHLKDDEYIKAKPGHFSGAAFHPNQNRSNERPLPYGVKGHEELWNSVFGAMKKDNDGYYMDIMDGIGQAIKSGMKGRDWTSWETDMALHNKPEIHDSIVTSMAQNIRDKKLQTERGRKLFAKNKTFNIFQQAIHHGETRRRRGKGEKKATPDTPIKGLISPEQQEIIRKLKSGELSDVLSKVGRKIIAGKMTFVYGREQIQDIVRKMKQDADAADALDPIKSAQYGETDDMIKEIFEKKYKKKAALIGDMRTLLHHLVADRQQSYDPSIRESEVEPFIDAISKKKTIGEMIAAFASHDIVQLYLKGEGHQPSPVAPAQDLMAKTKSSNMPLSQSAKDIGIAAGKNWEKLYNDNKYLALAFNRKFFADHNLDSVRRLKSWVEKNKDTIDPDEYKEAMGNIARSIAYKIKVNAMQQAPQSPQPATGQAPQSPQPATGQAPQSPQPATGQAP